MECVYGRLHIEKDADGDDWLLSYRLEEGMTVLRLHVSVGGPWDWHCFRAEVQRRGEGPCVLGEFDIAPIEIIPRQDLEWDEVSMMVLAWDPDDEPEFQQLPPLFRLTFGAMVREWGRVGLVIPAPTGTTIH